MTADTATVKKVYQTQDETFLNKYLAKGWTLLAVSPGKDEQGYPIAKYSYGWARDGEPVEPTDEELYGKTY